ncbi:cytochrome P450 [Paraphoma chrysanthemicola]|nr:cytochrome P450 [Paraphoma chrysanthemicola]
MLLPVLAIVLVPLTTYLFSSLYFKARQKAGGGLPASVPYLWPFIAHTGTFAAGSDTLAGALRQHAVSGGIVRFKGIGFNFVLLSGAEFIRKALSTNHFDWNVVSAPLFGGMFGGPQKIIDAIAKDNSGIGVKPYPGTDVHPGRRLMRNQVIFFSDAFSKSSLDEMVPRFVDAVEDWCKASNIGKDWVEMPDLYLFLRDVLFDCGVVSIFGQQMLDLNPDLCKDFWEYDTNIGFLALGMPRWMRPDAPKSRDRMVASMKRWRQHALKNDKPGSSDDATWDPAWGLGAIKRRNKLLDATEGLFEEDGRASIDLALIWSMTSNVIPASFWYMVEVLASKDLLKDVRDEIDREATASVSDGRQKIDPGRLTNNALLQAVFAETLRLHVATLITRTVKKEHTVGSWLLKKDQNLIVSSNVEHLNEQWDVPGHPASDFEPRRFLVAPEASGGKAESFSLENRKGQWVPFGLGEHMCPGRHFAKMEMIVNAAVMFSKFDFELLTPEGWRPKNDYARYGFGTQQPAEKVPFRIRRRS